MITSSPTRNSARVANRVVRATHVTVKSETHCDVLTDLFDRLCDVSTLPEVAHRVILLATDPHSNVNDLTQAIQSDPALAASVLRRVNSSFFALRSKVADLRSAISLLGYAEVRNLCLSIFVSRMFEKSGHYRGYRRDKLWEHCAGVAISARIIARVVSPEIADESYTTGLLHHLGSIIIDQQLRAKFCQILDQVNEFTPNHVAERRELSFSQAQLGEFVTRRWSFPEQVSDAIGYYQIPDRYQGKFPLHVHTLAIADYWCNKAGWTSYGVRNAAQPPAMCFETLGLDPNNPGAMWEEVRNCLPQAALL